MHGGRCSLDNPGWRVVSNALCAVMCRLQTADYLPQVEIVREARHWLQDRLDRWELLEGADDAGLLLTELVTNAVIHTHTPVHVVAAVAEGVLEVGVGDHDAHAIGPRLQ